MRNIFPALDDLFRAAFVGQDEHEFSSYA